MANKVQDVVCGMMIDPDTAPAQAEYQGKMYYFCAPGCKVTFEEDPEKYLHSGHEHAHHQH